MSVTHVIRRIPLQLLLALSVARHAAQSMRQTAERAGILVGTAVNIPTI